MHGPAVTNIECGETADNALKSDAANNMKEEEPGHEMSKRPQRLKGGSKQVLTTLLKWALEGPGQGI